MPPEENTSTADGSQQQQNANAGGQTAANDPIAGAATQTAQTTEAQQQQQTTQQQGRQSGQQQAAAETESDKKFTQGDLDKYLNQRLGKKLRAELIKRGIDPDAKDGESTTKPTVDSVAKERDDALSKLRVYEAAEQVEEFITDKRNNAQVRNMRGLLRLIRSDYEFDDDGKVTNLKELIAEAKRDAPELFGAPASSVDAGAGGNGAVGASMNDLIRRAAGR